jgi:hypothetical protein
VTLDELRAELERAVRGQEVLGRVARALPGEWVDVPTEEGLYLARWYDKFAFDQQNLASVWRVFRGPDGRMYCEGEDEAIEDATPPIPYFLGPM